MVAMIGFSGKFKILSQYAKVGILINILLTLVLLTFRNPLAPNDSRNYLWMYAEQKDFSSVFNAYHGNIFFSFTQYAGNLLGIPPSEFLIIQSIFFFTVTFFGLRMIFKSNRMLLMSLSLFVLTSTFVLLFTNVIRQGLASSFIILSLGLLIKKHHVFGYLALIISIFSHFSAFAIALIIVFLNSFKRSKTIAPIFPFLLPAVPLFSQFFLVRLSVLGGAFQRIETLSHLDYSNNLVYVKVAILYGSLVAFYIIGAKRNAFLNADYNFIFKVYFYSVLLVFFTLPILLLSSRFVYYSSSLLPILITYSIFNRKNILKLRSRVFLGLIAALIYGAFVYSFDSTRLQLGI